MQKPASQIILKPSPKPIKTTPKVDHEVTKKTETSEIGSKQTSPTLIEFQSNEAQLPDWRLQLKNAVLKRKGESVAVPEGSVSTNTIALAPESNMYPTSGGNALKAEVVEETQPDNYDNKQLANALKRIERSRKKFYAVESEIQQEVVENDVVKTEKPVKEFPFTIASRNENPQVAAKEELKDSVNFPPKPTLVPKPDVKTNVDLYDTSELDPEFISARISSSFEKQQTVTKTKRVEKTEVEILEEAEIKVEKNPETEANLVDDIAPFSLRFNAGLFDIIIGSLASMILLAPFMLLGGEWLTVTGGFAFLTTCSIVMFIYMTTTIGLFGKTFGMHLFTLEMIDYFEDEYPTFHQAAVSSSIYLLSIAVFGLGFVTSFFDEDKRAVHDLVSGTVIVKEI